MINNQNDINVFATGELAGKAAGKAVEDYLVSIQDERHTIRIIFAAAPSQTAMLDYLSSSKLIAWHKIEAFHMDEYLGLLEGAEQHFAEYLKCNLFLKVPLKAYHLINTQGNIEKEKAKYSKLINTAAIDIVCLGIGENGHIAFNDPPVADFNDPETLKVVTLDEECRIQQVNDKCFEALEQVPKKALTLTIPTLVKGEKLFCVVLGPTKSEAVKNTLTGPVSEACPASILTQHPDCAFYFDKEAYKKVKKVSV
ncbi:MAG: glucosamine-6-phosphate deaminase [Pseudozobellia sp.]|nr:glucosamine-6-phosphate deaminase [Pseudozobellia sp.]|tara:strand:- start:779 stop:1540 length:762 start_codon:yes stop_codon:yes gene_type:complete